MSTVQVILQNTVVHESTSIDLAIKYAQERWPDWYENYIPRITGALGYSWVGPRQALVIIKRVEI